MDAEEVIEVCTQLCTCNDRPGFVLEVALQSVLTLLEAMVCHYSLTDATGWL